MVSCEYSKINKKIYCLKLKNYFQFFTSFEFNKNK